MAKRTIIIIFFLISIFLAKEAQVTQIHYDEISFESLVDISPNIVIAEKNSPFKEIESKSISKEAEKDQPYTYPVFHFKVIKELKGSGLKDKQIELLPADFDWKYDLHKGYHLNGLRKSPIFDHYTTETNFEKEKRLILFIKPNKKRFEFVVEDAYESTNKEKEIAKLLEPNILTSKGKIIVSGGCVVYQEGEITFTPIGNKIQINLNNKKGYFYKNNKVLPNFKTEITQETFNTFIKELEYVLKHPKKSPGESTRNAEVEIKLSLSKKTINEHWYETGSKDAIDPLLNVIDDFVASLPVESKLFVLREVDKLAKHVPLPKDRVGDILNVELRVPDPSSTQYYTIYKSKSVDYDAIEARFNNSNEKKGMVILKLNSPISFSEFESKYGKNYSVAANAPGNPNSTSITYKLKNCKLSFGSNDQKVKTIVIDWTS